MENSTTYTGIVMLVAFVALIIYLGQMHKIKNKRRANKLKKFGEQHHLVLSDIEVWNHYGIGINTEKNALIYGKGSNFEEQVQVVTLDNVKGAWLNKITKTTDQLTATVLIELRLTNTKSNLADTVLELFNIDNGFQLGEEISIGEKWAKLINNKQD